MTVVAAYNDGKRVWVGSDSMGTAGSFQSESGPKLIKKAKYVVGYAISYRVANIIQECKDFPKSIETLKDLAEFRNVLKAEVQKDLDSGLMTLEDVAFELIIISPHGIFVIEDGYQIHKHSTRYYAIGGGQEVAAGAMCLAEQLNIKNGKRIVEAAVKAAIKHNAECSGNCYVRSVTFLG